jgi:hypothetical protein
LNASGQVSCLPAERTDPVGNAIDFVVSGANDQCPSALSLGLRVQSRDGRGALGPLNLANRTNLYELFEAAFWITPEFFDRLTINR